LLAGCCGYTILVSLSVFLLFLVVLFFIAAAKFIICGRVIASATSAYLLLVGKNQAIEASLEEGLVKIK